MPRCRGRPRQRMRRRSRRPGNPVDGVEQGLGVERLDQEPGGSRLSNALARREIVVRRDEDDRDRDVIRGQALLELESAHAIQVNVQHQATDAGRRHRAEKVVGRGMCLDEISLRLDEAAKGPPYREIVVYDGDQPRGLGRKVVSTRVMILESDESAIGPWSNPLRISRR
jgi:hypothetical protein